MIVSKKYHFYAAHRNELLQDKCSNIHGHTYYVTVDFDLSVQANGVTLLFSDIDSKVEPIIKQFDHCFIIHVADPLLPVLEGKTKLYVLDYPSSAENMAMTIYNLITNITSLPVMRVTLQETTTSTVIYEPQSI
jgi:6-pyruvoyltetrahydropterin/6-carboxytetrahydropterin synthase